MNIVLFGIVVMLLGMSCFANRHYVGGQARKRSSLLRSAFPSGRVAAGFEVDEYSASESVAADKSFKPQNRILGASWGADSCVEGCTPCDGVGEEFSAGNWSCRGDEACVQAASSNGSFIAGDQSCNGESACEAGGSVGGNFISGDESCNGDSACSVAGKDEGTFLAGESSCIGDSACGAAGAMGGNFTAGDGTCVGLHACETAALRAGVFVAGDASCVSYGACIHAGEKGVFVVGSNSCNGTNACFHFFGSLQGYLVQIGNESCQGERACAINNDSYRSVAIGDNSCKCDGCCEDLRDGSIVGDGQCNTLDDGCFGQYVIKTSWPTNSPQPSQAPSGMPSLQPSTTPSTAPSMPKPSQFPSTAPSDASKSPSSTGLDCSFEPPCENPGVATAKKQFFVCIEDKNGERFTKCERNYFVPKKEGTSVRGCGRCRL